MGAAPTELIEPLFDLHARNSEVSIVVEGKEVTIKSPVDAIRAGLALVPEDRKSDGLVLELDVKSNICLTTLDDLQTLGLLSTKKESALAEKYIGDLIIKTSSQEQLTRHAERWQSTKNCVGKMAGHKAKGAHAGRTHERHRYQREK